MADAPAFMGLHFWVADMPATLAFYRLAGLPIPEDAGDGDFFHLDLPGGVSLAFGTIGLTQRYDAAFEAPSAGRSHVCLQLLLESREAIDEVHGRLTGAGYASHLAPFDAFWGSRYCEVIDPDGNVVGFQSPSDREHTTPPP